MQVGVEGRQTSSEPRERKKKPHYSKYTKLTAMHSVKWAPVTQFFFVISTTFLICRVGEELHTKQRAEGSCFF